MKFFQQISKQTKKKWNYLLRTIICDYVCEQIRPDHQRSSFIENCLLSTGANLLHVCCTFFFIRKKYSKQNEFFITLYGRSWIWTRNRRVVINKQSYLPLLKLLKKATFHDVKIQRNRGQVMTITLIVKKLNRNITLLFHSFSQIKKYRKLILHRWHWKYRWSNKHLWKL